jgi:hypothetical protein
MNWTTRGQCATSDDGRYEMRGAYAEKGHFEWRGRVVDTDQLVCASADREIVKLNCERHAARVEAEASA